MKTQINTKMVKISIQAQCREWYGAEDFPIGGQHGRYKNKGGQEFVIEVPVDVHEFGITFGMVDEIKESFNSVYNKPDAFFRYEAMDVTPYYAPKVVTMEEIGL